MKKIIGIYYIQAIYQDISAKVIRIIAYQLNYFDKALLSLFFVKITLILSNFTAATYIFRCWVAILLFEGFVFNPKTARIDKSNK